MIMILLRIPCPSMVFMAMVLALSCLLAAGCAPAIGDSCETSVECGNEGEICDVTVPDGYCTIKGCTLGGCPDSSICVRFDHETSYCMASCEAADDCRDRLACISYQDTGLGYCYAP